MTPLREEAENFIRLVEDSQRGRLQLCLSQQPAARQARSLLELASYLQRRGVDVVLGYVDFSDPDSAQLSRGLPRLEPIRLEYQGVAVETLDLPSLLRRRPQVAVVQDLAHGNAPGATHQRRHQDVESLLAAGINVLASADPRQLEGLPGLPPAPGPAGLRGGLPAAFWRRADRIVLLDQGPSVSTSPPQPPPPPLPAEALAALGQPPLSPELAVLPPPPSQRLMVCLPSQGPQALQLLRGVANLLRHDEGSWFAVHVRANQCADEAQALEPAWREARRLGAEVVLLKKKDPFSAILDFASAHGVRHIALGRSRGASWKGLLGLSLAIRLLRHGQDFDLHVLDLRENR